VHAKVISSGSGEVILESVTVVRIRDGRLGFATRAALAERLSADPHVTVVGAGSTVRGVAEVVRSGTAYEEVRGRTSAAEGRLARWAGRLRRDRTTAVVLVAGVDP
jgi:hypothetical protein